MGAGSRDVGLGLFPNGPSTLVLGLRRSRYGRQRRHHLYAVLPAMAEVVARVATTPTFKQAGRRKSDLVEIAGHRLPGQADAVLANVVLEPQDDVEVEVKHGLPGRVAAAVQQVDTVCSEPLLCSPGHLLGEICARRKIITVDVQEVSGVRSRNHECHGQGWPD